MNALLSRVLNATRGARDCLLVLPLLPTLFICYLEDRWHKRNNPMRMTKLEREELERLEKAYDLDKLRNSLRRKRSLIKEEIYYRILNLRMRKALSK